MQRGALRLASGTVGYAAAGTGQPLLLLHGWGASGAYWRSTTAALADLRRCYALDLPGFGESPALTAPASLARLADLVVACADELGLAAFDLNGHSFGASVAAYVVARHPARVRRLVLSSFGLPGTACERQVAALVQPAYALVQRAWEPWLALMQPWFVAARPW
jgi:pimeloyl-ACP methyl ester carboxylesterase